jgi:thiol-disulfide isomerase/thioredoxin
MDKADSKTKAARWRGYAINVLLFVAIVIAVRAWQQRDMVSGTAPALQGVTLTGHAWSLPAHPAQPVLVHFWATWCPVCRAEQGSIDAIARDHEVITVAMQSGKPQDVARYLQEQGVELPVVNDADGSISGAWGVHAVPASFIIGTDGRIRFVEVGYTTEIGLKLRLWLSKY